MFLDGDLKNTSLSGELTTLKLVDILRVLHQNQASGKMAVTTNQGTGDIFLEEGAIVHCNYRQGDGDAAILNLLASSGVNFRFSPSRASPARSISRSTGEILAAGDSMDAEWDLLKQVVPLVKAEPTVSTSQATNRKQNLLAFKDKMMVFSFVIVTVPLMFLAILLTNNLTQENKRQFQVDIPETLRIHHAHKDRQGAQDIPAVTAELDMEGSMQTRSGESIETEANLEQGNRIKDEKNLADAQRRYEVKIKKSILIITSWVLTISLALVFVFSRRLFGITD